MHSFVSIIYYFLFLYLSLIHHSLPLHSFFCILVFCFFFLSVSVRFSLPLYLVFLLTLSLSVFLPCFASLHSFPCSASLPFLPLLCLFLSALPCYSSFFCSRPSFLLSSPVFPSFPSLVLSHFFLSFSLLHSVYLLLLYVLLPLENITSSSSFTLIPFFFLSPPELLSLSLSTSLPFFLVISLSLDRSTYQCHFPGGEWKPWKQMKHLSGLHHTLNFIGEL